MDVNATGTKVTSYLPYVFLLVALLIALGFEFVNGFHDTANAVATVIYTNSLPAEFAVMWSGLFNFLGVLFSSGAVAFGIVSLLPVELIHPSGWKQRGLCDGIRAVDRGHSLEPGYLVPGTWYLGLPASSSHTLIGSIIGVGIANALMRGRDGTWALIGARQSKSAMRLLLSPLIGFICAATLLLVLKSLVRTPTLYNTHRKATRSLRCRFAAC